jgi:hypothetical protein
MVEYRTAENMGKQILCARLEDGTGQRTTEWQHCDLFADGLPDRDVETIPVRRGAPVVFAKAGLHQLREAIRGAGIGAENFVWPPPGEPGRAPRHVLAQPLGSPVSARRGARPRLRPQSGRRDEFARDDTGRASGGRRAAQPSAAAAENRTRRTDLFRCRDRVVVVAIEPDADAAVSMVGRYKQVLKSV